ncbi:MAG: class II aldolase/adducin family protein [Gammaproteobacteria bacterium]|nr:class II aldolase/adducin family protein [Gammaproteobacteria bacterium]MDH3450273.1 class II aldolase/adducin family protein [Gammaproteobacteria bacterium]
MKPETRARGSLAQQVIDTCIAMNTHGINQGSSGNVSLRYRDGFLITPSGMPYDRLAPDDIVFVDLGGKPSGVLRPSSEWRMHRDIYARRPEAGAVLHVHSTFATALSCLRIDIPAFHYMIAVAGGTDIRCADYALFGTQDLSDNMLVALEGRRACLLGTHGMICFHDDIERALWLGIEVETLARQYWHARQAGEPVILSDAQMQEVIASFADYGKQPGREG